jgi:hypothetical protein
MAIVRGEGQGSKCGKQSETEMERRHRDDRARDDLRKSFAGTENRGPEGNQKKSHEHSRRLGDRNPRQEPSKK